MHHEFRVVSAFSGLQTDTPWTGSTISVANLQLEHRGIRYNNCLQLDFLQYIKPDGLDAPEQRVIIGFLADAETIAHLMSALLTRPIDLIVRDVLLDGTKFQLQETPRQTRFGMFEIMEAFTGNDPARLASYCAVAQGDMWPMLEAMGASLLRMPTADRQRLAVPLRWFAKGTNSFGTADKLISHWIAFNCLYGDTSASETEAIAAYVRSSFPKALAADLLSANRRYLETLSTAGLHLRRKRNPDVSGELGIQLSSTTPDLIRLAEAALLCVYAVRNNLFHGDWPPDPPQSTTDLIGSAEMVLMHFDRLVLLWPFAGERIVGKSYLKTERFSI